MGFKMQLYSSNYICFLCLLTFLGSSFKVLQGFPTLTQIVSLNIGLKPIISMGNQGHPIWELQTRVYTLVFLMCMESLMIVQELKYFTIEKNIVEFA